MTAGLALLLILVALIAGVGVTAVGPGGIFLTIALFALAPLSPAEVAGTASATMVVVGLFGSAIYYLSGELKQPAIRQISIILSVSGIVGGLVGSWLNSFITSANQFAVMLGVAAMAAGAVIIYQEWRGLQPRFRIGPKTWTGRAVLGGLGLCIGAASGLLGVGGPVLAVPALVVLGMPILSAIAVAQVQSVFVALFATAGYVLRGAVEWPLALLVGTPLLVGAFLGWKIAKRIDPRQLKLLLGSILMVIGPILAR